MDWTAIRELNESSIHWGGLASMQLMDDPSDPMPPLVFGDLSAEDFLHEHLMHLYDPLAAGFGRLVDSDSESTTLSAPWSTQDPSYSFYDDVLDNVFFARGPALPSDEIRTVPKLVETSVCVRGIQVSTACSSTVASSLVYETVSQVWFMIILSIFNSFLDKNDRIGWCWNLYCYYGQCLSG